MFGSGDLDALAKQAKAQLAQQVQEGEEAVNPGQDLYAEFRDEGVNSDTMEDEEIEEEISILNKPKTVTQNPALQTEPDEEYYQQERPELHPYDEPLFPGGPTITQVESWKKQWEGYEVYATEICGQYFIFRTLNRFEYKQLVALKNIDPLQREEIICETVTLWPSQYKWDRMATDKAGIPSTYAQIIMERSGFTKEYSIQVL